MYPGGPSCDCLSLGGSRRKEKEGSIRSDVFEVGVEILLAVMLVQPLKDTQLVALGRLGAVWDLILRCQMVSNDMLQENEKPKTYS